jgi:DNA-binding MarR family transcriptional regulator
LIVKVFRSGRIASMASDQLVEDLLSLWRVLRKISHPVRQGEITPQQYWLLSQLWKRGSLSIGELADAVGVSQSAATTACKRLERSGLVTRERQSSDERVVLVGLTEHGRAQFESWRRHRREALAELLAPLSDADRAELQRLIERVLAVAEAESYVGARSDVAEVR